jgi:hypothetical protein
MEFEKIERYRELMDEVAEGVTGTRAVSIFGELRAIACS